MQHRTPHSRRATSPTIRLPRRSLLMPLPGLLAASFSPRPPARANLPTSWFAVRPAHISFDHAIFYPQGVRLESFVSAGGARGWSRGGPFLSVALSSAAYRTPHHAEHRAVGPFLFAPVQSPCLGDQV